MIAAKKADAAVIILRKAMSTDSSVCPQYATPATAIHAQIGIMFEMNRSAFETAEDLPEDMKAPLYQ